MYLKITKKALNILTNIFYAVSFISISILIVLNTIGVYKYAIYKYELERYTGLSSEVLMDNYKRIIYYVQNPFASELTFNSIQISKFAQIHFFEVRRIFLVLYFFSISFIIIMCINIFRNRHSRKNIIKNFNSSINIAALLLIVISAAASLDFSKAFIFFHKIFFRNDYWLFDPKIDPIIDALPEEFFMIEFVLIISLLLAFTVIIKVLNFKMKSKINRIK